MSGRSGQRQKRRGAAAELHLPVEYVTAAGLAGRCHVEVASAHYGGGAIRAKAAAVVRRALAGAGAGGGRSQRGRRGGSREYEVFEL